MKRMPVKMRQKTVEEYIEIIYVLQKRRGAPEP
jgi:hypothetical protein